MDDALRIALWNALTLHFWNRMKELRYLKSDESIELLMGRMWLHFFKRPWDTLSEEWYGVYGSVRDFFFACEWYEVYDLIEFVAQNYPASGEQAQKLRDNFVSYCNLMLEREVSAYRFVGDQIAPVSSEEEINAIDEALAGSSSMTPVHQHLRRALELIGDREQPDYRNSIKESISAVEALCRQVTGDSSASLGQTLKQLDARVPIHGSLRSAFEKLYGYTSDAGGIRHALLEESTLDLADAKFMLVSCSAFVNFLMARVAKQND